MIEGIIDEDAIMIVIDRNAIRTYELAWLVAFLAELGHERAAAIIIITREYLHSMIGRIHDEQETSMMVERQAQGSVEQAISIAMLLGADRELDSSISIKSIVSHLFHFNLSHSLTTTKRDIPIDARDQQLVSPQRNEGTGHGWLWEGGLVVAVPLFLRRPRCASSARPSPSITSCFQIECTISCRCGRVSERD